MTTRDDFTALQWAALSYAEKAAILIHDEKLHRFAEKWFPQQWAAAAGGRVEDQARRVILAVCKIESFDQITHYSEAEKLFNYLAFHSAFIDYKRTVRPSRGE